MASAGIALKVRIVKQNQEKTMKFSADQAIWEVVKEIAEKMGITEGVSDHSLFVPAQNNKKAKWLIGNRTLKFYDIQSGTTVEFKKKTRVLKVKLVDNTVKTVLIDDSENVSEITAVICKKVLINNPEEYSVRVDGRGENEWLNPQQGLHEQDVTDTDTLVLGKKFFYHDANIDRSDPVQLHLFFSQAKNDVLLGKYPLSKDEARDLAALQVQIEYSDHNPTLHKPGFLKIEGYIPPQWRKDKKDMEKNIFGEHKKLVGLTEMNAKFRYVQLIRSLKTFGITFFTCKEKGELRNKKNKGKWVPILIGITREKILRVDPEERDVVQEVPLTHLKRWAAKQNTFTFDYGDYADDYYQVQTAEGDAMSQLIAGYIDIILKSRREALRAQEEDSASYGTAETLAHQSGVATATSTTSYSGGLAPGMQTSMVMAGGQVPQYQSINADKMAQAAVIKRELPPSHKVNVLDILSAAKAVSLLIGEMEAEESEPHLEAYETSMTIDQVKNSIGSTAQKLEHNIATLLNATDPSNMDPKVLNATAKAITADLLKLANMSRSAASIGGTNDQDIVSGAKQVSSAIAKLLEATQKVQANPHDPKTRAALELANREVKEAMLFMKSAKAGLLNDKAAAELAYEIADNINKDVKELCGASVASLKTVKDGNKMRDINNAVKSLKETEAAMQGTAKMLGTSMMDPEARKRILDAMNEVANLSNQLSNMVKDSGAGPDHVQNTANAVTKVNQDIAKFIGAMETAESRSGADLDFGTPHQNAISALSTLRDSAGDSAKVLAGIRAAVANTNELVAYAKRVAETSNKADSERLNKTLANVNDAVAKLIQAAKDVAAKPADPEAQARMAEAAARLEACLQEVVTDAGASAVTAGLRSRAKEAACKAYHVNRALEDILSTIQDPQLRAQLQQQIAQSNQAIAELVEAAKAAAREPQNQEAQLRLLQATQKALVPMSQIVASTKRVVPGITDPNLKQALNYSANSLADKLQHMMQAIKNVSDLEGQQEIEEALEQFQATTADLEAAEFAAQSGFLTPLPGQNREDGIALLDMNMKQVVEGAEETAQVAREPRGRKLGEYAKNLANSGAQVAAAAKTVASTTKDKQNQKAVLGQAKRVNNEIAAVISAARALAGRRDDPRLQQALTNATTAVKGALSTLNSLSKGIDSREADEAIEAISKEAAKLAGVQASGEGGPNYKAALDNVTSASKALNAALGQLASVARANPRALGAAARLVTGTVQQFVTTATAAAQYAATQEGADALLQAASDLVDRCNNAINVAKQAAANKDADSVNALTTALGEVARAIEALQQRSSHPDADRAVNRLMELTAWLDQPGLGPVMTPQQVLDTLDEATQNLAASMAQLVSAARMGSNKLGQFAKEATQNLEYITAAAKAATNPPDASAAGAPTLSQPGQAIVQAASDIVGAPEDGAKVVAAAKSVAVNASKLIANAKTIAGKLTDRVQQQNMLKIAHALATSTSRVARAAQAPKGPDSTAQLVEAANELKMRTLELESASNSEGGSGVSIAVDPMVAKQLMSAAKTTSLNVAEAIRSSSALTADTTNDELSAQLSYASKNVTDAIGDLLKVAQAFNPGKVQMDQTAETLQQAVSDLYTAGIQLTVGRVESPTASQKSHQDWQEDLVNISRDLASDISSLVDASRQDANSLRLAGLAVKKNVPALVLASKNAAATTTDPNLQRDLLALSKDLADSMLGLVRAAKDANPQNRPSQQTLVEKSKKASQAIGKLVSVLKANVVILKELDESVQAIQKVAATVDQPAAPSGKDYAELKDQLTDVVMSIAEKASSVNSADRSNIGQIGLASKQLADTVPALITKARDAISTTPDASAKSEIATSTKGLASAISGLIDAAKKADTSPQSEALIGKAFTGVSQASAALLKSLKKGSVAEQQLENALETIKLSTATLNSSTIFAQAGQLEPTADAATVSAGAASQALVTAAQHISQHAAYLAEVTKGTQQQYSEACANAAGAVKHLGDTAVRAASKLKDNVSQQNLLTAAKALAITTQQLVLSGREAQRKPNDSNFSNLASSVESTNGAIKQLLEVSAASTAEAAAAEQELEQAKQEIASVLLGGDANPNTTPEELISAAKDVTKSVSELVFAQNQEGTAAATKAALDAIRRTFAAVRGAAKLTNDAAIKNGLLTSATSVGKALAELFESAKLDRTNDAAQVKMETAATAVTSALGDLVKAVNKLPNANNLVVEELSLDMGTMADQEMDALAQTILDAAKSLEASRAEVKSRAPPKAASQRELEQLIRQGELAEEVLASAKQIADETNKLVGAASVCQKERKASPSVGQRYRMDPTWNNGLVSAARAVSDAVHMMVKSANAVVRGKLEEEALIVSARGIASSTAQLVTASKVRGPDANSKSQQNLSTAAKGVANSTSKLLQAARKVGEAQDDLQAEEGVSEHGSKIKFFSEQMRILKLEKELMSARKNLGNMQKSQYQQAPL